MLNTKKIKEAVLMFKKIFVVIGLSSSLSTYAVTLDFQDFVPSGSSAWFGGTIDDFFFDEFDTLNGAAYSNQTSGYANGWIGESTVGYIPGNGVSSGDVNITRLDGEVFNFNSVYLTSAWTQTQIVTIRAWLNGEEVYPAQYFDIQRSGPTLVHLDLIGVDRININGSSSQVVFEDLVVNEVPLPAAAWLFSTALMLMAGAKRSSR